MSLHVNQTSKGLTLIYGHDAVVINNRSKLTCLKIKGLVFSRLLISIERK
jgi:hypothetical protein